MKELWYRREASDFGEALPIGNGSLGAMVYGGVGREKLSLNEDTLWSGYPGAGSARGTWEDVREGERLLRAGDVRGAEHALWEKCLSDWSAAYQPAGNLWIAFSAAGEPEDYRRSLNLEEAVAVTEYRAGGVSFRREAFCSFPDRVLAVRCTSQGGRDAGLRLAGAAASLAPGAGGRRARVSLHRAGLLRALLFQERGPHSL